MDFAAVRTAHLAWRLKLRDLLDGASTLDEKEAVSHRDCQLGKWLYDLGAFDRYRDLEAMGVLEPLHEEMHGLVKRIVSLKKRGQGDEAEKLYTRIEPLSRRIVDLLRQIEHQVA